MKVYFDNAATTPLAKEVIEVMIPIMESEYGNPSSTHFKGRVTRSLIEKSRKSIASLLGASPSEIFFTSGGTEADNMVIRACVEDLGIKHIITSKIEHHAVLHTVEEIAKKGHAEVSFVDITEKGHVDLEHLEYLLQTKPRSLVTLMHANNEIGNMIDLHVVGNLVRKYNGLFHSDTVQTVGYFNFDLKSTPVDFINAGAHKFNGPKGVGFVYINGDVKINPMIQGGSQERNMRGGTENVYAIVGMAKALELCYEHLEEKRKKITSLKNYMAESLVSNIPGISFNGDFDGASHYTVLNACFPKTDKAEMLLFNLDINGIAASGGSACSSGSNVGSHVLSGIKTDPDRPSVRFSFGQANEKEEIDYVITCLKKIFELEMA